ncbi:TlpA family protein disulfide reductase [Polynucleobacter rarus]|uniref:TlpA family protein disulfide reductase n=1 Tax=Polynucleobacter rarus TaxID=556055 RepID=UPI001FEA0705|nr:TlpA disulfide reductase family protein [Polynucleobacter rarus]
MSEEINKKSILKKKFPLLLMLSLIGLGSLLLGIGASYWLSSNSSQSSSASSQAAIYQEFMAVDWKNETGENVNSQAWKNKILVINFWASWCPPCVEEMPMLSAFNQKLDNNTVQMIGIGIDSPSNLRQFLQNTTVTYPILLGGLEGSNWMKRLGNSQGALPYTVILNPDGKILLTKLGKITEKELESVLLLKDK